MSDAPAPDDIRPLNFVQHRALTIDEWPQWLPLTEEFVRNAYLHHGTVDGDTLRFAIGNGESRYLLRRDLEHGQGFLAELQEGNDKANLASRKRKYLIRGPED